MGLSATGATLGSLFGPTWLPGVWATLIMLALGVLAWRESPGYSSSDEFADNFYFLGFLLTLLALLVVLVGLRDLEEGLVLPTVLAQFGLALITTFVGLTGRTVFLMNRPGSARGPDEIAARIEQAQENYHAALTRLTSDTQTFSVNFSEQLEGSFQRIHATVARVGDSLAESGTELVDSVGSISDRAHELDQNLSGAASAALNLSGELDRAAEGLTLKVSDLGEGIEARIGTIAAGIDELHRTLSTLSEPVATSLRGLTSDVHDLRSAIEPLSSELSQLPNSFQRVAQVSGQEVQDLEAAMRRLREGLSRTESSLGSISSKLAQDAEEMGTLVSDWRGASQSVAELHADLRETTRATKESLARLKSEISAGVDFLTDTVRSAGSPSERGRGHDA